LSKLYYSSSSDHSRYLRRMDRLGEKRDEALLFVTAAVGLSLGINLLSSALDSVLPVCLFWPLTGGGLLVVIAVSYLSMWRDTDSRESIPILFYQRDDSERLTRIEARVCLSVW
jgi:hypothetical protein